MEKDFPPEDWQVAQGDPRIEPMKFLNLPSTLPTRGSLQRTFDCNGTVAVRGKLDIQHPHISNIQRNSDLRVDGLALLVPDRSQSLLISWQLPAPQYVGVFTAAIKEPAWE